jgi:hypothetical protein
MPLLKVAGRIKTPVGKCEMQRDRAIWDQKSPWDLSGRDKAPHHSSEGPEEKARGEGETALEISSER